MKSVLLYVCLIAAAVSAPTTLDVTRVSNLEGDVADGDSLNTRLSPIARNSGSSIRSA